MIFDYGTKQIDAITPEYLNFEFVISLLDRMLGAFKFFTILTHGQSTHSACLNSHWFVITCYTFYFDLNFLTTYGRSQTERHARKGQDSFIIKMFLITGTWVSIIFYWSDHFLLSMKCTQKIYITTFYNQVSW